MFAPTLFPRPGRALLLFSALAGAVGLALATRGGAQAEGSNAVVSPLDSLRWKEVGRGLSIARLDGIPTAPGRPFAAAMRLKDGAWMAPHSHVNEIRLVVVSGRLLLDFGPKFDAERAVRLSAGGYARIPAGSRHTVAADGGTVFVIQGVGSMATTFERTAAETKESWR